jgi:hypothetical protein
MYVLMYFLSAQRKSNLTLQERNMVRCGRALKTAFVSSQSKQIYTDTFFAMFVTASGMMRVSLYSRSHSDLVM